MVHPKAKSGDPDFDDKVPMAEQIGETVEGPDGERVTISPVVGPTKPDGSHADLDGNAAELDNRPTPGDVATESSEVQVATAPPGAKRRGPRRSTSSTD